MHAHIHTYMHTRLASFSLESSANASSFKRLPLQGNATQRQNVTNMSKLQSYKEKRAQKISQSNATLHDAVAVPGNGKKEGVDGGKRLQSAPAMNTSRHNDDSLEVKAESKGKKRGSVREEKKRASTAEEKKRASTAEEKKRASTAEEKKRLSAGGV